ncbi:MAG: AGE family epimerase/isomerase [Verrucomicrobiota bacterium]
MTPQRRDALLATYRDGLLQDVLPFWVRHGWDREHGGIMTGVDRAGALIETDKPIWFQGRAAWMYATAYHTVAPRPEWLELAGSCLDFIRRHGYGPEGKMYFTVTREGRPLRMRRYVYSECFAAIAFAAHAKATGEARSAADAWQAWATYLRHTYTPGVMAPKTDPATRPMQGLAPRMITIVTAQELRAQLGDERVGGATCTEWIDRAIGEIERDFLKPDLQVLLEVAGPGGELLDHFDGRQLNPGHAIEAAWFILHEAKHRGRDPRLRRLGCTILDWMWARGWDREHGGILYHVDVRDRPQQEYWHDMKFWWPHNEAIIATLLAWQLTGDAKYLAWHGQVHDWAYAHFPDREHGEWYGYLHRDGSVSSTLKGGIWKGPFHLPRMQWYCWRLLAEQG